MIQTFSKYLGAISEAAFQKDKLKSKSRIGAPASENQSGSSRGMLGISNRSPQSSSSERRLKQRRISRGMVDAIVDASCQKQ